MNDFLQIVKLIQTTRYRALSAVNSELVNLYWQVGQYVSMRLEKSTWGDGMVAELAAYIKKHHPEIKGFDKRSLYRMCLFYQTYSKMQFVAPLVRQIQEVGNELITIVAPLEPQLQESSSGLNGLSDIRNTILTRISWSHHLIIIGRCKSPEEREFYIRLCIREHYSKRELDRQISSSAFERVMIGNAKLPESIRKLPQEMANVLKDSYVFEFLNDFLKTDRFEAEYLGKTNFYLEALDRDVRNANENPSIGVLLCKDRDEEVVEYALSRSLSPTMVARYLTQMPDKKLLQQKLHELFEKEEKNNLDQ